MRFVRLPLTGFTRDCLGSRTLGEHPETSNSSISRTLLCIPRGPEDRDILPRAVADHGDDLRNLLRKLGSSRF